MVILYGLKNKFGINLISFMFVLIVGFFDYITGPEIYFSLFYLIPIIFVALYKNMNKNLLIINIIFASLVWFYVEHSTNFYSNEFGIIWNSFVRLSYFYIIGMLSYWLKEKYKKLVEINEKLEKANEEKNRFIGIAAHDLRNPIGVIFSFSDIIMSEYSEIEYVEVLDMVNHIREISQNTLKMLENILDISKIESGTVYIKKEMSNYTEFLKKQIFYNSIIAEKKSINIKLKTKIKKDIFFQFDKNYMIEVIDNLITNAIKFSYERSEITIKVSITKENYIKTEVIDKGIGIPEEEHHKLFKYFNKTSTQPTSGEISTGLGLAIVKKIIEEHNGKIGVVSEFGKGSNFYFELPFK